MKNLWPEKFEENSNPSAKSILEEQTELLPKITNGIVDAEVVNSDDIIENIENDFSYRFNLIGRFIKNYRFKVLSFFHDITLYPVYFNLDEEIATELGYKDNNIKIQTPESLEEFLRTVLQSERVKKVIGSIIKLSK
ncbi:MAG: hypothetical protein ACOYMG_02340 [Candidatus Methylumidiphilus sp.]